MPSVQVDTGEQMRKPYVRRSSTVNGELELSWS